MGLWKIVGKVDGKRTVYSGVTSADLQGLLLEEINRLYPGRSGKLEVTYQTDELVLRATSDQGTTILRCYQQKEETK